VGELLGRADLGGAKPLELHLDILDEPQHILVGPHRRVWCDGGHGRWGLLNAVEMDAFGTHGHAPGETPAANDPTAVPRCAPSPTRLDRAASAQDRHEAVDGYRSSV
jgi:hypothetical protein